MLTRCGPADGLATRCLVVEGQGDGTLAYTLADGLTLLGLLDHGHLQRQKHSMEKNQTTIEKLSLLNLPMLRLLSSRFFKTI